MAFDLNGWSKMSASANMKAPGVYCYKSTDQINDILAEGYFNQVRTSLRVGDILILVSLDGEYSLTNTIIYALLPNVKTLP